MTYLCLMVPGLVMMATGQSIDQMISSSVSSVDDFDFFSDFNGKVVRQELDMLLLKEQYDALTDSSSSGRKKRKAIRSSNYRWPDKTIPYKIAPGVFSSRDRATIESAMDEWSTLTCIKFREATNRDRNFIYFNDGRGCSSFVGKVSGSQQVTLAGGCRYKGVIVHEIGHAVGFHHEQNRPDRDNHVQILFQNIPENVKYNFKKYSSNYVNTYNVPYDYSSVMHYGGHAFSFNRGYTIKTRDPKHQTIIGNRKGLSFYDAMLANKMYECDAGCPKSVRCPSGSYKGKDCKCYCKGSPVRVCNGKTMTTKPPATMKTTTVKTTTPKIEGCMDHNKYCSNWAASPENYCVTNTYMKNYCKKSCDLCGSRKETCVDMKSTSTCKAWKRAGFCTEHYVDYMTTNCKKTCDRCKATNRNINRDTSDLRGNKGVALSQSVYLIAFMAFSVFEIFSCKYLF